jgi:hypothetical protein
MPKLLTFKSNPILYINSISITPYSRPIALILFFSLINHIKSYLISLIILLYIDSSYIYYFKELLCLI